MTSNHSPVLPIEIWCQILSNVTNVREKMKCRHVCRLLRDIVDDSRSWEYTFFRILVKRNQYAPARAVDELAVQHYSNCEPFEPSPMNEYLIEYCLPHLLKAKWKFTSIKFAYGNLHELHAERYLHFMRDLLTKQQKYSTRRPITKCTIVLIYHPVKPSFCNAPKSDDDAVASSIAEVFTALSNVSELETLCVAYHNHYGQLVSRATSFVIALTRLLVARRDSLREIDLQHAQISLALVLDTCANLRAITIGDDANLLYMLRQADLTILTKLKHLVTPLSCLTDEAYFHLHMQLPIDLKSIVNIDGYLGTLTHSNIVNIVAAWLTHSNTTQLYLTLNVRQALLIDQLMTSLSSLQNVADVVKRSGGIVTKGSTVVVYSVDYRRSIVLEF
ncbi:unnamed protein product [Sphagnum balticum]